MCLDRECILPCFAMVMHASLSSYMGTWSMWIPKSSNNLLKYSAVHTDVDAATISACVDDLVTHFCFDDCTLIAAP